MNRKTKVTPRNYFKHTIYSCSTMQLKIYRELTYSIVLVDFTSSNMLKEYSFPFKRKLYIVSVMKRVIHNFICYI